MQIKGSFFAVGESSEVFPEGRFDFLVECFRVDELFRAVEGVQEGLCEGVVDL